MIYRLRIAIALLFCSVLIANVASAQTADQWVYTDTLVAPWIENSYGADVTPDNTEHVLQGSNSIKVIQDGWSAFVFRSGEWDDPVVVDPGDYSHFEFAIYNTTPGLGLSFFVENDVTASYPGYLVENIPLNQWVNIAVPMADINPDNISIHLAALLNPTIRGDATYYVDAVRFIGQPSSGTPPTPTLFSPATNITGTLKWPTLSWLSSPGATSYRVQVSVDTTFSSPVYDDSTVTLTLRQVTGLENSTTYYWRVNAKNGDGTSSYSAVRRFTTQPPNTIDHSIYEDDLLSPWTTVASWSADITVQQDEHVHAGSYAMQVDQGAWGALGLRIGEWGPTIKLDPTDYDSLTFWLYSTTSELSISLYISNEVGEWTSGFSYVDTSENEWVRVSVPMSDLDPEGLAIQQIVLAENTGAEVTYYIDDIRLVAHQSSIPAAPMLVSPSNETENQSLLAMLTWHPSDMTTIDYQLQVALDSSFSTIHFNDSTIVDTSRLMILLDPSTTYYWRVNARSNAGRSPWSIIWHFTTRPDTVPVLVVGPIDRTVSTILSDVNKFIYTGDNRVQFGMDTSQLNDVRFSTIRGTVMTSDAAPLPGVRVTILNQAEVGYTFSRSDGMFDMVVNGGGIITVEFRKDGFLTLHRQILAPWQDYAIVDSVVMIHLDAEVTTVNFASPIEVARGSEVTDDNGARQATLLFKEGTEATMLLPDSTTQPLSSLRIRATEYTVGATGPAAMPIQLPPTSGYTYCVELSADEAVVAGATEVQFDHPIAFYIENFLDFPVGVSVPVGWYDRIQGAWVPADNGRVIKIIHTTDGIANVDIDGDDIADEEPSLDSLGINTAELQKLALLYSTGQTLWRSEVSHFSSYDCNFAYGPPLNANYPPDDLVTVKGQEVDNSTCSGGSIIGIERQTLGEAIGITGTPYNLHYQSDRVRGYREIIEIPLTGEDVTADRIVLAISVAGRLFEQSFSPSPNLKVKFAWDGKDAYGRFVQGRQSAVIRVGNVYSQVYYTRSEQQRLFEEYPNIENSFTRDRGETIRWTTRVVSIGTWELRPLGLGGWSFNVHHSFEPTGGGPLISLGDGLRRSGGILGKSISTVAGNGEQVSPARPGLPVKGDEKGTKDKVLPTKKTKTKKSPIVGLLSAPLDTVQMPSGIAVGPDGSVYVTESFRKVVEQIHPDGTTTRFAGTGESGYSGDGGLAIDAKFGAPTAVAVGPDGSVYVADDGNYVVRRIAPDGIITTVAGDGTWDFGGDGGLATEAKLGPPTSLAVGSDGNLFIADPYNARIRRVSTDGLICTAVGNGAVTFAGDSGFAANASFIFPECVALDNEGNLYITDGDDTESENGRIRRVTRDGIITTIAGTGEYGYEGDGGQATEAMFSIPGGITVDGAGIVYVSDKWNHVVRRITPDGIITTFAGTGVGDYNGDGGAAIGSYLHVPTDVAIAPDGSVYIVDSWNNRIRRVSPPLPGYGNLLNTVVSDDGAEIYVFNQVGKHLRTEDALTRVRLTSFSYDSTGRLSAIMDVDSLITIIERDSTGSPSAIVSPFGQRTILALSDSGYLASITNPASDTVQFVYASDGLMQTMTDARSNLYEFTYDTTGRLIRDEDPAGGFKTLTRSELSNGFQVQVQTATGKSSQYRVENISTGGRLRTTTDATGLSTVTVETDNRMATTMPDGMVTVVDLLPDPRFGMVSPLMNTTVVTPNGLQSVMTHNRFVTQMTGLEVTGLKDSVVINDKTYTTVYDGSTKTFESTSPEGRVTVSTVDTNGRIVRDSVSGISALKYIYDSQGFLTTASQSIRTTAFSYDAKGRLAEVTDPLLRSAQMFYDSVGRVIRQVLADGREILYAYDANGNLTALTPPGRDAHTFEYTVVDLTHKYAPPEIPPDSNWATDYLYNLDKQLTYTFLPDGDSIVVRYDTSGCGCGSLPRPAEIKFDRGSLVFTYDSTTGNVVRIIAPSDDTLSYTYDGSLPLSASWSGNVNGSVAVKYDNDFRVVQQTVNGVDSVGFAYDQDGLLREAGDLKIKRHPGNGLFLGDTLGSIVTNVGYNSIGEMSSYEAKHGGTPLFATTYERDSLGRITMLTETIQSVTTEYRYGYDLAGRLKQVWRNDTLQATYFYDANGNRDSVVTLTGTTRGTYDAQDRMLTYGNASYFYTTRGSLNMKVEGTDTIRYTYDLLGNLTKVELPNSDVIEYLIDAQNRRVGKKLNGQVTARWIYSGQLAPIAELDSIGNVKARFVYATHVNIPDYIVTDTATYRVVTDHLGSLRLVVDEATGTVVQRMDYDSWGNVLLDSNLGFAPFGFAGGMYESQTELVRFGARDYEAASGRWAAKDPIGFRGGMNLYLYVGDNPVTLLDPFGLQVYPADFIGPIPSGGCRSPIPTTPEGVDINRNIQEAGRHVNPFWFREQVRARGPWDYKRRGGQYENFGNFNYGATGIWFGFSEETLLREAGRVQANPRPEFGDPGTRFNPFDRGVPPYGDDPNDAYWIKRGIEYTRNGRKNPCVDPCN